MSVLCFFPRICDFERSWHLALISFENEADIVNFNERKMNIKQILMKKDDKNFIFLQT